MVDWPRLVALYGNRVWRTAFRILGRRADAEDVYQEVFAAAYQADPGTVRDWGAFLAVLATRRSVDRLRARVRLREEPAASEPPGGSADPFELAAGAELLCRVREVLATLPPRQAEAFWLSAIDGHDCNEVARLLGTSPGSARVLIHRARSALAAALAPSRSDP